MSDLTPPAIHRPKRRRWRWYNPVALARGMLTRPKLYLAVVAAAAAWLATPASVSLSTQGAVAWIAGATIYLALALYLMSTCDTHTIRTRAALEDETRFVFFILILLAIATSFAAVVGLISEAKAAQDHLRWIFSALAGATILTAWLVMQVAFTLHYAHEFYWPRESDGRDMRGLIFPGDEHPDYWDFFYFTTSIGATSQTSDVAITSKSFRRFVALQAIVSFIFNTTVIAMAINLAAGLL